MNEIQILLPSQVVESVIPFCYTSVHFLGPLHKLGLRMQLAQAPSRPPTRLGPPCKD